nr:hypothetical protein [Sulfuracidifex metallicus]
MIISLILASSILLVKDKRISALLSGISIAVNSFSFSDMGSLRSST